LIFFDFLYIVFLNDPTAFLLYFTGSHCSKFQEKHIKSTLEKSHVFYNNILSKKTETSWKMTSKMDPRGHYCEHFLSICASHFVRSENMDFGRLWAGAGGRGWGLLKLQILQIVQLIQHAMLSLKGVRRILRAAAGPSKVTGARDL